MKFENSFEVPLPPEEAWPLLLDVPRIAPCFPGAELTEVLEDRRYKGRVGDYPVMPMSEAIPEIILQGGNAMQISEVVGS